MGPTAGKLLQCWKKSWFPTKPRGAPFMWWFKSVTQILVAWAHFQTSSHGSASPADVVNTHILIMSFNSPCKYTDVCNQWLVGTEQTRDDRRSDSFHTSKNCLAKLPVPGAMATPSAMLRNLPRFFCEWLFPYRQAFLKHLDAGCQIQMCCIYLGFLHISMTSIRSPLPLGCGYSCVLVWLTVVQHGSTTTRISHLGHPE